MVPLFKEAIWYFNVSSSLPTGCLKLIMLLHIVMIRSLATSKIKILSLVRNLGNFHQNKTVRIGNQLLHGSQEECVNHSSQQVRIQK